LICCQNIIILRSPIWVCIFLNFRLAFILFQNVWKIPLKYTANPGAQSLRWKRENIWIVPKFWLKTCFNYRENLLSLQGTCFQNRDFPACTLFYPVEDCSVGLLWSTSYLLKSLIGSELLNRKLHNQYCHKLGLVGMLENRKIIIFLTFPACF
jgi:hypothetical protein